MTEPQALIVMGVSGAGKTTVGRALAARLQWLFLDADAFHPQVNVDKMRRGVALDDRDRAGWLGALRRELDHQRELGQSVVLACSALRAHYRDALGVDDQARRVIFLRIEPALATQRVSARAGHYMPSSLVASQFETLQEPSSAIVLDAAEPLELCVERCLVAIGSSVPC